MLTFFWSGYINLYLPLTYLILLIDSFRYLFQHLYIFKNFKYCWNTYLFYPLPCRVVPRYFWKYSISVHECVIGSPLCTPSLLSRDCLTEHRSLLPGTATTTVHQTLFASEQIVLKKQWKQVCKLATALMNNNVCLPSNVLAACFHVLFSWWFVIVWNLLFKLLKSLANHWIPKMFLKDFIYLFLERGEEREKEERNICGYLSCAPNWGSGLQPRHVPWLGIKPATLWLAGPCSIHWATPARAQICFLTLTHLV